MRTAHKQQQAPPNPEPTYAEITIGRETQFEFAGWQWVVHADNGGTADVITRAERTTGPPPDMIRFTLGTDTPHTVTDATERVELEGRQQVARYVVYRWKAKMHLSGASPADYAPYGETWKGWMVLMQVHQTPEPDEFNGSPPLGVLLRSDDMLVVTTRSDELAATTSTSPIAVDRVVAPFTKDAWHDVDMSMKFSKGEAAGYLKFVWDGETLFDQVIPLGFNDVADPYLKFGLYRNQSPGQTVLEYNEMSIV